MPGLEQEKDIEADSDKRCYWIFPFFIIIENKKNTEVLCMFYIW